MSLSSGDAQDLYVLALVTQKGGSGKSTLAVGLAVAAIEKGECVAFLEADPQGTNIESKERREGGYHRSIDALEVGAVQNVLMPLLGPSRNKSVAITMFSIVPTKKAYGIDW